MTAYPDRRIFSIQDADKLLTGVQGGYIIAPLMQTHCPDKIDLWNLAAVGGRWEGEIPLREMSRLLPMLHTTSGKVSALMEGGVDEQGVRFISGRLQVSVEMICQRCMKPATVPLAVDFCLGLIHSDIQAATLPQGYEPLLVPTTGVVASELVEDELILALPFAPKHRHIDQCRAHGFTLPDKEASTPHPFAALATLLKTPKDQE